MFDHINVVVVHQRESFSALLPFSFGKRVFDINGTDLTMSPNVYARVGCRRCRAGPETMINHVISITLVHALPHCFFRASTFGDDFQSIVMRLFFPVYEYRRTPISPVNGASVNCRCGSVRHHACTTDLGRLWQESEYRLRIQNHQ